MLKLLPWLSREDLPDNSGDEGHAGDKTEDAPLWLTNRARNCTESPLYRLPYDVAVLIYAGLDDTTKRVLRQTTALYRKGFVPSAETLNELARPMKYRIFSGAFNGRQLGPVYAPPTDANKLRTLNELLRRDSVGYCAACRDFRASGGCATALHHIRSARRCGAVAVRPRTRSFCFLRRSRL